MVIEMPKDFHIAPTGTINYQNIKVKVNFPEDKWVVAAEMRAGNARVVHHARAIVPPPGASWMKNAAYGDAYEEGSEGMGGAKEGTDLLGKYNPGLGAQSFDVDGSAKFVPKGSDIVFNLHYTSAGTLRPIARKSGWCSRKHAPANRYFFSPGLRLRTWWFRRATAMQRWSARSRSGWMMRSWSTRNLICICAAKISRCA